MAIETIYVAIQTFIYSLLLYSMIGFHWRADKFFLFYFFVFMCFVYFTSYGMMLVALTPNYMIAAIVMSFFLSFWNLFSGFLIPRTVSKSKALQVHFILFSESGSYKFSTFKSKLGNYVGNSIRLDNNCVLRLVQ